MDRKRCAWSQRPLLLSRDVDPDYLDNAAKECPYRLRRQVIRGGSWKDAKHFVRADIRSWEYQNEQRSFVGFRCVRTYLGTNKVVKQGGAKKSKKGSSSAPKQSRQPRQSGGGARSVRR